MTSSGTLKLFMENKGCGFIENDDGSGDVFVHFSALTSGGQQDMLVGSKVMFDLQTDERSGKTKAGNVTITVPGTPGTGGGKGGGWGGGYNSGKGFGAGKGVLDLSAVGGKGGGKGMDFGKGKGVFSGKGMSGGKGMDFGKGKGKGKGKDKGPRNNHMLPRSRLTDVPMAGTVAEWKGKYGWLFPPSPLQHEKAREDTKLFVSSSDLAEGQTALTPGAVVQFHVFEDSSGLGAEEVMGGM